MPPAGRYGSFGNWHWQIREDWEAQYRDWTLPGFRALAAHRFGAMLKDRKRGVLSCVLSVLYRSMFRYIWNHNGIELPPTTIVGRRFLIGHQSGVAKKLRFEKNASRGGAHGSISDDLYPCL